MEHLTTTPFGQRPVTAGLIERASAAQAQPAVPHINKWELFRELCTAKAAFAVTDRDLTVLNALLSFHQQTNLSDNDTLIVFPSNAALAQRAHGMAESTLRRHLAALVQAGLIQRHDSPNGKRYAIRGSDGELARVFGFDLRPLLVQADQITHAASEVRAAAEAMRRMREDVTLTKRDAVKLVVYGQENHPHDAWEGLQSRLLDIHKRMRRNLGFEAVAAALAELRDILAETKRLLSIETEKMSGSDIKSERHFQNSNKDSYELELCHENGEGDGDPDPCQDHGEADGLDSDLAEIESQKAVNLPLALVVKACPDILPYAQDDIRRWRDLVKGAALVRGMMGISPDAWSEAQDCMGSINAAITVSCILQRITEINSPGGYLRALSRKAAQGGFSPGPMVMALLNGDRDARKS